jgi:hypothetical protein
MPKTIALKGDYIRKEREANAAITPGDLIEVMSTGNVRVHATVGGQGQRAFALENDLVGRDWDAAYAAGDAVQYGVFVPGAEVYARVTEAANLGDALESAGDGRLQVASTPVEGSIVAYAAETVGGAGRIKIEVA